MDFQVGSYLNKYPFASMGSGDRTIVVFPPTADLVVSLKQNPEEQLKIYGVFRPSNYRLIIIGYDPNVPENYSNTQIAHDFAQIIEKEIGPAVIVGVSYGGFNAIPFAAHYPHLTQKLVLMVSGYTISESGQHILQASIDFSKKEQFYEMDLYYTKLYKHKALQKLMGFLAYLNREKSLQIHNPPTTIINSFQFILDNLQANENNLSKITSPTLVIGAEFDQFISPEIYQKTAATIPNAKLVLYKKQTHMVPVEKMRSVKKQVFRFLKLR